MVRAILAGNKTQTRRIIKPWDYIPDNWEAANNCRESRYGASVPCYIKRKEGVHSLEDCENHRGIYYPNRDVDDILYVRETWLDFGKAHGDVWYKASLTAEQLKFIEEQNRSWKPSIFMPKKSARIFLRITNVRVERLHSITENDIKAEGFSRVCSYCQHHNGDCADFRANNNCRLQQTFAELWDKINAKRDFGWESNPWVLVYEFEVIKNEV
jgi:hypothetical protein